MIFKLELSPQNFHYDVLYPLYSALEEQYFIESEPKGEVTSSKIDQLAAIYTSKFKWAWWAQFLSRTLQILEIH